MIQQIRFHTFQKRSGNTTDQPQSRWALSNSIVFDGHTGDGADYQAFTYQYENGRYDRAEREFYGYAKVTEGHRNTTAISSLTGVNINNLPIYRSIVRAYLNDTFYNKGLLISETTHDSLGRKYLETINTYNVVAVDDDNSISGLEDYTETRFPKLTRTDRQFYEGNTTPGKSTYTTHEYDS